MVWRKFIRALGAWGTSKFSFRPFKFDMQWAPDPGTSTTRVTYPPSTSDLHFPLVHKPGINPAVHQTRNPKPTIHENCLRLGACKIRTYWCKAMDPCYKRFMRSKSNSCHVFLWHKIKTIRVTFLHMPRQLSCRGMCNTVTWLDHSNQSQSKNNFTRFQSGVHKPLVKQAPGHKASFPW